MAKFKRNLITTALPYANGPVHIGHLAGVYVPADIYVRYLRQKGEEVVFIGGSDEHGVPITIKAQKEGVTRILLTVIIKSSKILSKSSVSLSISIPAQVRKHIMNCLRLSLRSYMTKENSSRKLLCSSMMRKPDSFWLTAIL